MKDGIKIGIAGRTAPKDYFIEYMEQHDDAVLVGLIPVDYPAPKARIEVSRDILIRMLGMLAPFNDDARNEWFASVKKAIDKPFVGK